MRSRTFVALTLALLVAIVALTVGDRARRHRVNAAPTLASIAAPTWTSTPALDPATAAPPAPTSTPDLLPSPTPPPPPSPTAVAATATPPPPAPSPTTPPLRSAPAATRIDVAGPIALPTVAPLPIGQGRAPVRLLIPALQLDIPVLAMGWHVVEDANGAHSEWDVIDNAAGHHIDSVYPGEAGNVVLSGHNNIGGAVFRTLCVIGEPGVDFGLGDDMILVDEAGRRFTYQVNGWQRMPEANASLAARQENARYMAPTNDAQLTLVTCWPPTSNTHRVVVTGLLTGKES